jgi:mRNA-degrading endonuclease RelE of RelBE toxin-antitoxin system
MSYNVKTLEIFEKQARRLIKKYASLKSELSALIAQLKEDPKTGTPIGSNCYKIRLAIVSKGKGKSGGARVIIHIVFTDQTVYLLSVYDKFEKENLTQNELKELLFEVMDED